MLDKKTKGLEKKLKQCALKKSFFEYLRQSPFIINSNNQELMHHIHYINIYFAAKQNNEILLIS